VNVSFLEMLATKVASSSLLTPKPSTAALDLTLQTQNSLPPQTDLTNDSLEVHKNAQSKLNHAK
jgi:hypothetical protein